MLGQRPRRWPNIEPTLDKCTMFEGSPPAQQTQNICVIFIQRRPNVSTLDQRCIKSYKCFVLTGCQYKLGVRPFHIPAVIQSVCLQAMDQVGTRAKGFELSTHRSIYELAVI